MVFGYNFEVINATGFTIPESTKEMCILLLKLEK